MLNVYHTLAAVVLMLLSCDTVLVSVQVGQREYRLCAGPPLFVIKPLVPHGESRGMGCVLRLSFRQFDQRCIADVRCTVINASLINSMHAAPSQC